MRDEERRMAAETGHPTTADPETLEEKPREQSSRVTRWLLVLVAVVLAVMILYGYLDMPGSRWIGVANKEFWDYLELLIVPAALAIGVYWLNRRQTERDNQAEAARRERELELARQRAQDAALQAYLDQMSQLLIDKERPLRRAQPGDNLSTVARARTLTMLTTRLDGERKRSIVQFLYESKLIDRDHPVVSLNGADLSYADLGRIPDSDAKLNLSGVDLSGAQLHGASFEETILKRANLSRTNLSHAGLIGADLTGANLQNADLWDKTNLYGATLIRADLRGAELIGQDIDLTNANLEEADLREAVHDHPTYSPTRYHAQSGAASTISVGDLTWEPRLQGTNLKGANLHYAKLSGKRLAECKSLEGATMPNGQKYEEWLKTPKGQAWLNKYKKGRGEDRENSDP